MKGACYGHDTVSFGKMWDQVGEEAGSKWRTKTEFRDMLDMGWESYDLTPDKRVLQFTIERLE